MFYQLFSYSEFSKNIYVFIVLFLKNEEQFNRCFGFGDSMIHDFRFFLQ